MSTVPAVHGIPTFVAPWSTRGSKRRRNNASISTTPPTSAIASIHSRRTTRLTDDVAMSTIASIRDGTALGVPATALY